MSRTKLKITGATQLGAEDGVALIGTVTIVGGVGAGGAGVAGS